MKYRRDRRIIMTLDGGGTKLAFSALRGGEELIEPLIRPTGRGNLETTLKTIIDGFEDIRSRLPVKPAAVSIGFPAPADYRLGIIGDLENIPAFRGGVALGPMLEDHFEVPVIINNDGDLFAFGEYLGGMLPEVNKMLEEEGNPRRYGNLLGVTMGTGMGGGIVAGGRMLEGDNSAQGEINRVRNRLYTETSVEDSVSVRGVRRVYARESGIPLHEVPSPKEIFDIAMERRRGDLAAARRAYTELAIAAGDAIANAVTLLDGLVVIGGGLSGAYPIFLSRLVEEMNAAFLTLSGHSLPRMEVTAFNLEDPGELHRFLKEDRHEIRIPFSDRTIVYDGAKRVGVGITRLGAERAVALGAWATALERLDKVERFERGNR